MIRGIDHVVILVQDLAAASADCAALGFTVVPGGRHASGRTHNALVCFADGSYLELLAPTRPGLLPRLRLMDRLGLLDWVAAAAPALERRWARPALAGEGLLDLALLPDDTAAALADARARGLALAGPFPGSRRRPDGQQVAWQLAIPDGMDLPFLCGDVTPRDLRVPGGAARVHVSGVTGIAGVTVAVADLDRSAARWQALTGAAPQPAAPPPGARRAMALAVGGAVVTLAEFPPGAGRVGPWGLVLRRPGQDMENSSFSRLTLARLTSTSEWPLSFIRSR